MRDLHADVIAEKNRLDVPVLWLYRIEDYDGSGGILRFSAWDTVLALDGQNYTPQDISHDIISQASGGAVDTCTVTIQNVNRQMQAILEAYELRGLEISLWMLFRNLLPDDLVITHSFTISSVEASREVVTLTCTSRMDHYGVAVPRETFRRNNCRYVWKGTYCKFSGAGDYCRQTLQGCRALNNTVNYGGEPAMPLEGDL